MPYFQYNIFIPYIKLTLIIEIDGKIHLKQKEQDELRTSTLNEKGYKVIRFKNEDIFTNAKLVVSKIKEVLDNRNTIINDDASESPSSEGLSEAILI